MTGPDRNAATRPAPPDLEFQTPDCSVCGTNTAYDGDHYWCENCGATWGKNGEEGEWPDGPDAPQCRSLYRNPRIGGPESRCWLPANIQHDEHHNPEDASSWTKREQTGEAEEQA